MERISFIELVIIVVSKYVLYIRVVSVYHSMFLSRSLFSPSFY